MKKSGFLMAMIALGGMMFITACNDNDDKQGQVNSNEVRFTASANGFVSAIPSRVTDNDQWQGGDKVGIFMVDGEGNVVNSYANMQYGVSEDIIVGSNVVFGPINKAMYFPTLSDKFAFIAYYNYDADMSDENTIIVEYDNDFLYTKTDRAYDESSGPVKLSFKHKMVKLVIEDIRINSAVLEDGDEVTVNLMGFEGEKEFNLLTGMFTTIVGSPSKMIEERTIGSDGGEIILFPTESESESKSIKFTYDEKEFIWDMKDYTFVEGHKYVFVIDLQSADHKVKVSGEILGWEEVDEGGVDVEEKISLPTP